MDQDVRDAFEELATRGERRGAEAVVSAALLTVHPVSVPPALRRRRLFLRRLTAAAGTAVVAVALVAAAGLAYLTEKAGDISTVEVGALAGAGAATPAQPMTVLVVGVDEREGLEGMRADTIMLLRVDPVAGRLAVLSVPRDLWVPLADQGREQRINTALEAGPDVLVRTIGDVLGVAVDHYVQIDFDGFRRLVDVVGGVEVAFPAPARDELSGLDVAEAGCATLDGTQALALVRSRHFQQLVDGRWVADPTGDLGRIARQQAFLVAVLGKVAAARNPLTVNRLVDVAVDHLVVDQALSPRELVELGRKVRSFDPAQVPLLTVPATPTTVGQAAVLALDEDGATAAVDQLLGRTPRPGVTPGAPPTEPAAVPAPSC